MSDPRNHKEGPFLQLVNEILVSILCECDIPAVLSVGLANRRLHTMTLSKQIWVIQVGNLQRRGFVDRLLENQRLKDLSVTMLIDLAKRPIIGPKSWSKANSKPVIAQKIHLDTALPPVEGQTLHGSYDARLIPGGHFVLLSKRGKFECWSIDANKLVWEYEKPWDDAEVHDYAVEIVDEGTSAMILVCIRRATSTTVGPRENHIEILRLDLGTFTSTSILSKLVPGETADNPFYRAKIEGDFAFVGLKLAREEGIVVVQLSTAAFSIFLFGTASVLYPTATTLSSGHIVALYPRKDNRKVFKLAFWSANTLVANNEQVTDIESVEQVACVSMEPLGTAFPDRASVFLDINPSPLYHNSSTLWATVWDTTADRGLLVYKFHISHSKTNTPSITKVWSRLAEYNGYYFSSESYNASYSGCVKVKDVRYDFFKTGDTLFSLPVGRVSDLSKDGPSDMLGSISLSAYSGAFVFATMKEVEVVYYE